MIIDTELLKKQAYAAFKQRGLMPEYDIDDRLYGDLKFIEGVERVAESLNGQKI